MKLGSWKCKVCLLVCMVYSLANCSPPIDESELGAPLPAEHEQRPSPLRAESEDWVEVLSASVVYFLEWRGFEEGAAWEFMVERNFGQLGDGEWWPGRTGFRPMEAGFDPQKYGRFVGIAPLIDHFYSQNRVLSPLSGPGYVSVRELLDSHQLRLTQSATENAEVEVVKFIFFQPSISKANGRALARFNVETHGESRAMCTLVLCDLAGEGWSVVWFDYSQAFL